MAKNRYVNTAVWKDPWFVDLRLTEQHLWLYLLTNGVTNLAGVYPISLREMAFDTTIDQEEVKRIFNQTFQPAGKAYYEVGFVVMKNWHKHQTYNAKTAVSVATDFNMLPDWLRKRLLDREDVLCMPFDRLCIRYGYPIDGASIIELNSNQIKLNLNSKGAGAPGTVQKDMGKSQAHGTQVSDYARRLAGRKGMQ